MAEEKKAKKAAKKGFYDVEAPMTAVKISLYGGSAEEFEGKVVKLDLTKSLRGKSIELRMRVASENGVLRAMPISARLTESYIRRAMRKGSDYVEDSFLIEGMDVSARIKIFLITRMKVSRAVRKALRENAKKYVLDYVKIRHAKEIFSDIVTNKLQKGLSVKLKKIYPLALCEIKSFEITGQRTSEKGGEMTADRNSAKEVEIVSE